MNEVNPGDRLTEGNISPKELLAVTDPITAQQYILKEIQKAYRSQGVDISDKHIEVVVKRMISKIRIYDGGETNLLIGSVVSIREFTDINKDAIIHGKRPAVGKPIYLVLLRHLLKLIHSYQQHHSKRQQEFLLMLLLKVRSILYKDLRKMLLSVS